MKEDIKFGVRLASIIFFILFIFDLLSTLALGELVIYLEANPIYRYIGLTGICIFNIVFLLLIYNRYVTTKNVTSRYILLNILVTVILSRILIIYNNLQVVNNPPTIEVARQITTAAKTAHVMKFWWLAFIPYLTGILAFYLYRLDHEIKIKQKPKINWEKKKKFSIMDWTNNINQMKLDIVNWAFNVNKGHDKSASFWENNKTKFYTLSLFLIATFFFWALGWTVLYRVIGIITILFVISSLINIIKGWFK